MSGRHSHSRRARKRTSRPVLAGVAVLLCAVAVGMAWLWPDGTTAPPGGQGPAEGGGPGTVQVAGVVDALEARPCPADSAAGEGAPPAGSGCGSAQVRLTSGEQKGSTVTVGLPSGAGAPRVAVGDEVALAYSPGSTPQARYAIVDHQRGTELWVLVVAFVLAVVAFGRWRGMSALVGLGFTFTVILGFVIPAVLDGKPPLAVAIVGCAAIVLLVQYLTHGLGRSTTIAIAGTLSSLVLTGALSAVAIGALRLSGAADETSFILGQSHGVDLRGLLLAGILIGSLGVLDDVTITQVATVDELADANPGLGARQLYAAATRVGRAHIASVINTIVLAYAGASLPLLVLIVALRDPVGQILTDQLVATELVRSMVGTMGLIAAVPITTAAAALAARHRTSHPRGRA